MPLETTSGDARLRLLEAFLSHNQASDCATAALQWLAETEGVVHSICLARQPGERVMSDIAVQGLLASAITDFSLQLDDWGNPLVAALAKRWPTFFPAVESAGDRQRRPTTPFEDEALYIVPLCEPGDTAEVSGLLIVAGLTRLPAAVEWFVTVLALKLNQLLYRQSLEDGDRKLVRERSLLYAVVDTAPDPILMTDSAGLLLFANQHAEALFVASEAENEGRRRAVSMNNMLLSAALSSKALEATGETRGELLLVNPSDGSDLLFELLCMVTEDSRYGTGVVSVLRNVSDLRSATEEIEFNYRKMRIAEAQARAERDRLNVIIDSVADPIVVTDATGETSLMNQPAEQLFAVGSEARPVRQRLVRTNDARFSSFIAGMLAGADRQRVGELNLLDPRTGGAMPVEAIAGKMLSEQGELTGVVSILHDRREMLEKTRLYDQLRRASSELERKVQAATADIVHQNELLRRQAVQLEHASALKTQFLANMSHEFRTPLNAMLGYTSMLLEGVMGTLDPDVKRGVGRIESNGRHLLTVINEILDISRIEAGRMPLQISTFGLTELVNEVKAELEPIIKATTLSVSIRVARSLGPISSDRQKVKQILLNLMSNALKFTSEGTVTIRAASQSQGRKIAIAVIDTGVGIPSEDQDKIFEDFRQLDDSLSRPYRGTGLGLSICRRLAHLLFGEITVRSQVGKGSTFTLTLPRQIRRAGGGGRAIDGRKTSQAARAAR
jgi:signal transduction histidine kinase